MTKRVLVDARPLQVEAYATRGVGAHLRGWLNQASALQRQFDLEIALLLDRSAAVPPLPPFPRYFVRSSQHGCTCFAPDLMLRAEADLLEIAHVARADLVHVTYPLAEEFCPPGRLSCPSVVSLYDTILLDRAEAYLEAHLRQERAGFIQRIERLRLATRVQTLSRASAGDIARCLSPSPPPIDIVS
ncbi:MAG: hypothetical protein NZ693_03305, partial [Thermoflexales bacterium]|nr:hypothetical protein [Thermoflexales bacterium]